MTGEHFKEIVETICMTTGLRKYEIQERLGVSSYQLFIWQKKGVPAKHLIRIREKLRQMMFFTGQWRKQRKHTSRWSFHG
jgi:hypothetical protein